MFLMTVAGKPLLQYIVSAFVIHSLGLASSELDSEDFDRDLFRLVSRDPDLSVDVARQLHHAFHWGLVLGDYAPLEFVQASSNGNSSWVCFKEGAERKENSFYVDEILQDYGSYIQERLEKALARI